MDLMNSRDSCSVILVGSCRVNKTDDAQGYLLQHCESPPPLIKQPSVIHDRMMEGLNVVSLGLPETACLSEHRPNGQRPFALDIGGTLAKLAFFSRTANDSTATQLKLISFKTEDLEQCLNFIRTCLLRHNNNEHITVPGTGVGCFKYKQRITQSLGVELQNDSNEMGHALNGVDFLWRHLPANYLLYEDSIVEGLRFQVPLVNSGLTPCLLVSLGSALIVNKIREDGSSEGLVGASSSGGLTFLGLGALLTSAQTFEELVELAESGDRQKVDLFVKDSAGSDYNQAPSDGMVSSFGKAAWLLSQKRGEGSISEADIACSLLYMITDQMAQTVYLVAKCNKVSHAVFCGSFLGRNHLIMGQIKEKLSSASGYLQHTVKPVFMQYEGYMGAVGLLSEQLCPRLSSSLHDADSTTVS